MPIPENFPVYISYVCIDDDIALFAGATENEEGALLMYDEEGWEYIELDLPTISVTVAEIPKPRPVVLYSSRQVGRLTPETESITAEKILESEDTDTTLLGPPSEIRTIGKHAYVVGMSRSVHRCEKIDHWIRMDYGVRLEDDDDETEGDGFNSIDGFSEDDMYAVGWGGEVWHYDGKSWERIEVPTNVTLNRVVCASDGNVYIAGEHGVLFRGRNHRWGAIGSSEVGDHYSSLAWFKDKLYVGVERSDSSGELYVLEKDLLEPLTILSEKPSIMLEPFMGVEFMDANNDVMWVGNSRYILYTHDGKYWYEPDYTLPGLEELT